MRPAARRVLVPALAIIWLSGVASGLRALWAYDNRPGVAAQAPPRWPSDSVLRASTTTPTLVFVAHPQCSCTRASLDELAEILARAKSRPKTYVLFLKPSTSDTSWDNTELWRQAAQIKGVIALRDDEGVEARRFGVETSGQTMLYDTHGALLFSGGVTGSRGHAGDNDGEETLVALLSGREPQRRTSNVFGCPIFATAD